MIIDDEMTITVEVLPETIKSFGCIEDSKTISEIQFYAICKEGCSTKHLIYDKYGYCDWDPILLKLTYPEILNFLQNKTSKYVIHNDGWVDFECNDIQVTFRVPDEMSVSQFTVVLGIKTNVNSFDGNLNDLFLKIKTHFICNLCEY